MPEPSSDMGSSSDAIMGSDRTFPCAASSSGVTMIWLSCEWRVGRVCRGAGGGAWPYDRDGSDASRGEFCDGEGGDSAGGREMLIGNNGTMGAVAPSSPRQPLTSQCRRSASLRENLRVRRGSATSRANLRLATLVTAKGLDRQMYSLVSFQVVIAVLSRQRVRIDDMVTLTKL